MKPIFLNILTLLVLAAMNAQAATYYVATTGSDSNPGTEAQPFQTIQRGINATQNGDTVLVASGTYTGASNKNLNFAGKNIILSSQNGAAATIIDVQASETSPARGVQFTSGETSQAVLDGFTIKNGYVTGVSGKSGGGIYIENSSPTIRNCVLTNNTTFIDNTVNQYGDGYGGGVAIFNGSPQFLACTIANNTVRTRFARGLGGGISIEGSGSLTLTHCTITDNQATVHGHPEDHAGGGGVYARTAPLSLVHCMVSNNTVSTDTDVLCFGGGVYVLADATFTSCTISGNQIAGWTLSDALGGGVYIGTGHSVFTHCTLSRNRLNAIAAAESLDGGGIASKGTLTLTNCTLAENQATAPTSVNGGGVAQTGGSLTMKNCRLFGNSATSRELAARGGGATFFGGTATVTNTLFVGNTVQTAGGLTTGGGGVWSHSDVGQITFTNCTFAHNRVESTSQSPAYGGGIGSVASAQTTAINCIFTGDTAPQNPELYNGSGRGLTVSYSSVQGGIPAGATNGGNNINAAPLFVRTPFTNGTDDYGDLHLQGGSPCINAGSAAAPGLPLYDMDGYARNQGGAPEMGADEIGVVGAFDFYVDKATGNDTTGNGTSNAPFQTVTRALSLISDPDGLARSVIRVKAGSYGSDRPRVSGEVKIVNWGNTGLSRIGKP